MSERQQFLDVWEREFPTTLKVLKAFPADQLDFRPHERSRTAKELAWIFVNEQQFLDQVLDGQLQLPPAFPPAPGTWKEILATYEKAHAALVERVRKTKDEEVLRPIKFFAGPGQMVDMPRIAVMWFMLMDSIHHRGQLSVYLRMAGGKVPSIYGPSADEPWM